MDAEKIDAHTTGPNVFHVWGQVHKIISRTVTLCIHFITCIYCYAMLLVDYLHKTIQECIRQIHSPVESLKATAEDEIYETLRQ